MRILRIGLCLLALLHVTYGEERGRTEIVAESFDRKFAVFYQIIKEDETTQRVEPTRTSPEKERFQGYGSAGTQYSGGTVYIADIETGKKLLTVPSFENGIISAQWRRSDDYVIIGWNTERFNWDRKLFQRIRHPKSGETTFREIDLDKLELKKALRHDPKRIKESVFMITPQEWDRTNLIVGFTAINHSGKGSHPFAQDEVWYDARIAIRRDGAFEVVALWRTHGSESGMELVWEK